MEGVYICSACRTPIGKNNGQYSNTTSIELGGAVISKCIQQLDINPSDISQIIIGQAIIGGLGQNPARQAATLAKLPSVIPAYSINMLEASGLKAVYDAYNSIRAQSASIIFAGGQENVSLAGYSANLRNANQNSVWKDTVIIDGLTDQFLKLKNEEIADQIAKEYTVSRSLQDKYALMSHTRAAKAAESGWFDRELVYLKNESETDENINKHCSLEILFGSSTLCNTEDATVTSGNSASISDGAAGVLLMHQSEVTNRNVFPQARIVAISQIGCEPIDTGKASITAIERVLEKANWNINTIDLFEIDESFAVYTMLCIDTLNIELEKVNVSGGSISLGNPIGCKGIRMLVTMVHNLKRLNKMRGIVAVNSGGGLSIAIAIERSRFW